MPTMFMWQDYATSSISPLYTWDTKKHYFEALGESSLVTEILEQMLISGILIQSTIFNLSGIPSSKHILFATSSMPRQKFGTHNIDLQRRGRTTGLSTPVWRGGMLFFVVCLFLFHRLTQWRALNLRISPQSRPQFLGSRDLCSLAGLMSISRIGKCFGTRLGVVSQAFLGESTKSSRTEDLRQNFSIPQHMRLKLWFQILESTVEMTSPDSRMEKTWFPNPCCGWSQRGFKVDIRPREVPCWITCELWAASGSS